MKFDYQSNGYVSGIKVTRTAVQPSEPLTQTTSADVEKPIDQDLDAAKNTKHKNVNSSLVQSIDQTPNKVSDEELTNLCTPKWMESGPKRVCKNGRLAQERSKKATKN
ncbi:hypothetical protein M3Y98_00979900 [Aphelenchoides besseyi]|nr:hypothetical protein M3Y98_00978100 [Aphelenchoides besseyi]KAI6172500.1 hypothetical protein M3Y98_00979900 [Aphelenchoides besseyi]KAI6194924.1 hypothetical protein M3Y96_01176800 [Aphelenchoides besseyi]KAI6194942.1 hypothetical protein M3Y96_01178600 [Aphelenchoides besseyi]